MVLLQTFTPSANPLGSQWLSALLAVLPVLAMLITLGALRWKAHLAGLFSWGVALIVAITAFRMPIGMAFSSSVQGFLYGLFPISWILLGAIWMYQVTVISGRFDDLRRQLRLGMGPCQGGFCSMRATGIAVEEGTIDAERATGLLRLFLKNRWIGLWPILYGEQVRQTALDDWIFQGTFDVEHLPTPQQEVEL